MNESARSMPNDQPPARDAVQSWMVQYIASVIDVTADDIVLDRDFREIGMDSAEVVIMTGVLEEEFALEVRAELPFEHPNIAAFLDALAEKGLVAA
jgi:acyl carrier protein